MLRVIAGTGEVGLAKPGPAVAMQLSLGRLLGSVSPTGEVFFATRAQALWRVEFSGQPVSVAGGGDQLVFP